MFENVEVVGEAGSLVLDFACFAFQPACTLLGLL